MNVLHKNLKHNLIWLKWPVLSFMICLILSGALLTSATYYHGQAKRKETISLDEYNWLQEEITRIEQSIQTVGEYAGQYSQLVAGSVIGEEDRVALLEDIRIIRQRHKLFALDVDIKEQSSLVIPYSEYHEDVEEQLSLRGSLVQIKIPLLHEYDLTRFLNDFLQLNRLIYTSQCTITEAILSEEDVMSVVEHQIAICDFYWLTMQREPFNPDEHFY